MPRGANFPLTRGVVHSNVPFPPSWGTTRGKQRSEIKPPAHPWLVPTRGESPSTTWGGGPYRRASLVIQGRRPWPPGFRFRSAGWAKAKGVGMASRQSAGVREPQAPEWISLQRAALRFEVSVDTLRRRVAAGGAPGVTNGKAAHPRPRSRPRARPASHPDRATYVLPEHGPARAVASPSWCESPPLSVPGRSPHWFRKWASVVDLPR